MNKVVRIVIYSVWGIFSLLILVYLTFPTDVLRDVIRTQAQKALGSSYEIQIDDVSLMGLTGVSMEGIRLLPTGNTVATEGEAQGGDTGEGEEGGEGVPTTTFPTLIDEASGTVGLGSLLRGDPEVDFEIEVGGGVVYGSWGRDEENAARHVATVSAENVSIERIGFISSALGGITVGTLTGHVSLGYNEERRLDGGTIALVIDNFTRGPGPLPIPGLPAAPYLETPTRFGQLRVEATLDGSDINIDAFESVGGPDVEFQVLGRVSLRSPLADTSLFLTLQLGYSEQWKMDNGFESAARSIPLLRQACTADNQCAIALRGGVRQLPPQPLGP